MQEFFFFFLFILADEVFPLLLRKKKSGNTESVQVRVSQTDDQPETKIENLQNEKVKERKDKEVGNVCKCIAVDKT